MTSSTDFSRLGDYFRSHQKFLIISHIRPDGDAYGSTLALGLSLQIDHKNVLMVSAEGLSPAFAFLPGSEQIKAISEITPETDRKIISVDAAGKDRLGNSFLQWNREVDVNIDHHVSNTCFAEINCVDPESPATAQVLYELLSNQKLPLTAAVASNLFVGLSTDTGSFRHRQTTARTFEVAARLVEAGADATSLALDSYSNYPVARLLLLREVFSHMRLASSDRIAYFRLTPELCARSGATLEESKDIIEYFQTIRSIEVAFMIETVDPKYRRVSLRSRGKVDVQKIASVFGGGGHRLAAGIRSTLKVEELEEKILAEIEKQLVELS